MQAGDLRTIIRIQYCDIDDSDGFDKKSWIDIGNTSEDDEPKYIKSKWDGAYGTRAYIANSVQAERPAEVTIRYNVNVTEQCRLINDGVIYNIISPHDLDQHKHWMVFNVKAAVNG